MAIVFVGIDLAKNGFAVHGVNPAGKPELVRPSVPRAKLHEMIAALPPCTIGMEACSGAHHWARLFQALGHTVKLMAPKFVAPYRLSGKRGRGMSRQERPPSTASVACSVRWASCCR
jgi:transposase